MNHWEIQIMRVPRNKWLRQALALAGLLLLAGCSRSLLTAPAVDTSGASAVESAKAPAPAPPSLLGGVINTVEKVINWTTVAQTLVRKEEEKVVTGHRWSLQFEKGSLEEDALVTIQDYDRDVLDVQFGPHGTKFPVPVTLSVDFSNTTADPGDTHYDGSEPVLYWLDEDRNRWEEVPGRTDWKNKKHVVRLEHFSRYVVGSKAGWMHQPQREDD
jgi:hypothetical protein